MSKASQRKTSEYNHWFKKGMDFTLEKEIKDWNLFKQLFETNKLRGKCRSAALTGFVAGKREMELKAERERNQKIGVATQLTDTPKGTSGISIPSSIPKVKPTSTFKDSEPVSAAGIKLSPSKIKINK